MKKRKPTAKILRTKIRLVRSLVRGTETVLLNKKAVSTKLRVLNDKSTYKKLNYQKDLSNAIEYGSIRCLKELEDQ